MSPAEAVNKGGNISKQASKQAKVIKVGFWRKGKTLGEERGLGGDVRFRKEVNRVGWMLGLGLALGEGG